MLYQILLRLFFLVSPERVHTLVFAALRAIAAFTPTRWLLNRLCAPTDPILGTEVFGVHFPAPLGLAAGFDKDGEGLKVWGPLGFGYAEVGTVTAIAQPGNPKPRLFRLPADRGLLNRMGFNNHGAAALAPGWPPARRQCRSAPTSANRRSWSPPSRPRTIG